jgi:DHA1 family bicyclomycin/chloramphenicol resistance-like MFS transporter
MIAPIVGATVLSVGGDWRAVFWCLVVLGGLMTASAALVVPETLPTSARHSGGLRSVLARFRAVVRDRVAVGYLLVATGSAGTLLAYVANAAYVLEGMNGMPPLAYGVFFACTALGQVLASLVNARIVRSVGPRPILRVGIAIASAAVLELCLSVFALGTPLVATAAGFVVLMAAQGLIFGNASALAASRQPRFAGATSSLLGLTQAASWAVAAPLASLGGVTTAVPMVLVMLVGIALAAAALIGFTRVPAAP